MEPVVPTLLDTIPLWATALAVLAALWVDRLAGEPPTRWHPVVWMGRGLSGCQAWVAPLANAPTAASRLFPFCRGALAWCVGAAVVGLVAVGAEWILSRLPTTFGGLPGAGLVAALAMGALLKPLMAWHMLRSEVLAVEVALSSSLDSGRARLSWLCSRDVQALGPGEVRETAIETLAEYLNDSVVAPLFWFLVAGLPGAALYRWANTADAMWGYRGERGGRSWEWAGKWAARADDLLSWVPARLTGALLMLVGGQGRWLDWLRDARTTPSPNGGWPMAAMALRLGVRLGKPGVYTLNANGRDAQPGDLRAARTLARSAVACLHGLAWGAAGFAALQWVQRGAV